MIHCQDRLGPVNHVAGHSQGKQVVATLAAVPGVLTTVSEVSNRTCNGRELV